MNLRSPHWALFSARAAALCALALALAGPAMASPPPKSKANTKPKSKAKKVHPAGTRTAIRDGQAEARLIEVYRLAGQGQSRLALARAEALVREHPNFQLAQLVYGDLLAARARPVRMLGDVPEGAGALAAQPLADLREESRLRVRALLERPPAGMVPSQFLQLSPRSRHAIAIDTSRARLYFFENTAAGLKLLGDYYVSVGKQGIEKAVEGDLRTPLGVYYITSNLDPKTLKDFYGAGALPINYPNPYDTRRGKTGSGIWLHGTPPGQFARAPKASDGCVVLANPDIERLLRTVEVRTTPVVIAPSLQWVAPAGLPAQAKPFTEALSAWRAAKSSGDTDRLLSFYTADFTSEGKGLAEWLPQLRAELGRVGGRSLQLKDLSYLRWTDSAETMVVTFGEVPEGARSGPVKRQYWMRMGPHWKIFYEGVIG
ncbi:L,D-transpeptidase [Ramlibacter tataouinensis]|uniref:L,D-transpeptidase family protein n=1 Tax=Ramlibacter tataouinensis TaxID=94132 RepID=UPI0022F3E304|nr:L,D-transpeptidase [Ramlibacter tataouinensis]WBY01590.1 L,D-transpeptidase [Ramlibacter tataouinensis]